MSRSRSRSRSIWRSRSRSRQRRPDTTTVSAESEVMNCLLRDRGYVIKSIRMECPGTLIECKTTAMELVFEGSTRSRAEAMRKMFDKLKRRDIHFSGLRRALYDIENRISKERSEVQDTKDKLLQEYRSQNEELNKVNSDLQDSFNTEKKRLQERIVLLETQAAVKKEPCNCEDYEVLKKEHRDLQESYSQQSQILKLRDKELEIFYKKDVVEIE